MFKRNGRLLARIACSLTIVMMAALLLSSCNKKDGDSDKETAVTTTTSVSSEGTTTTATTTTNPQGIIFNKTKGWATASLRLRKDPSATAEIIGGVPAQGELIILGIEGDWYKVRDRAQEGYVSAQYVSLVPIDSTAGKSTDATTSTTKTEN